MKCMNEDCDNKLIGRQKTYCSDKCRKAQTRTLKSDKSKSNSKPEQGVTEAKLVGGYVIPCVTPKRGKARQKALPELKGIISVDVKDGVATAVTAQLHKDKTMTITQVSQEPTTKPNGEYILTNSRRGKNIKCFEGRRKDYDLLESWAESSGTEYQRRLGILARYYRDKGFSLERYLGVA